MSDYNELLKTIDEALAQTDKAQEPKNPTQAILDEIDAALGEKPEAAPVPSVTPTPVPSVTPIPVESAVPAPVPSVTPQPEVAVTPAPVTTPQPSPTPSPASQPVAELPKPTPSRLPEPTPPKEPEVDYSLPSNQFLAMVKDVPDEKWGKDEVDFLNTLSGKDLSEIKKQRPDVIFDDILNQKIFDYQRETTPYKIPETKEDFYNLTKASATFLGKDLGVMASELVGDVLVGGAKAVKQGVPFLLGQTSDYAKGLEAEQLLSPEKQQEAQAWRKRAWEISNTPLKGGEQPNPDSYTDAKYLEKIKEGLTKEQIQALDQKYEQKRMEAKQVPFETLAPLADLPPSLAFLGTKLATGGFQTWDSISEQAGLLTKEQAYERWKTRELLDSVKAKMTYEEPRAWARAMDVYKPIYAPTFSYFASLSTPSVKEMMIMDPKLTKEEAESKRKATIEANVLDSIEETKKSIPETDPELQAFGDVAIPGGFGLDTFGYALNVVNASKMLTPIARLKLKKLRYTDDEINALESKAQRVLKEKQLKELESKKTAGLVERAAGATAKGIEATGEYLERSPKFQTIAKYTPYVTGIGLGYEIDPENPLRGMVAGGLTAAGVKAGFKTLKETPKVIKEISAARRISAGGEMGPLATLESIAKQQDEVKNLTAKLKTLSEGTEEYIDTKKLLDDAKDKAKGIKEGGGEVVDYEGIGKVSDTTKNILRFASDDLISNIGEYAKMGIEPTILGLSMGMIDSSDEEELKGMIGSGLVFSLGGRAMQQGFHKFLGEDPVIAERRSRQASMDALKAYRDSSPETQGEIDRLTDWTNVLQRQENKIGQAQSDLQGLQAEGASPDKIKKAEKVLSAEQKSLSLLKTANVQTRNEFGKNFLQQLARNNMLINGSLKAGQNNVGFHILSTQQIFDHFRKKPEYRDVSDEDLMMSATQQGFYSGTGGNEYRPGMQVSDAAKGLVFDTSKPSIVVNSDALQNRMMIFGETPTEALNHETGHHFARIPEIQNAMGDARKVLFTNEIKDASGAVKEISNGLYSEKQLNEMFVKDYLKNRPKDQVAEIAQSLGVWDYNTNSLNAKDVGSYMQEEILAELFSNTLSRNLGKNLDSKQLHLLDVARLKMKNNLLKNAVTKVLGLGASSDVVSDLTNAKLPPEAQSAARNAVRLIQSMNGDFSTMASLPQAAPISRAEIKKSKIAAERYGMDSGLFATKVVAQVFDADGNPVGAAVDVNDLSVYEGSWRFSKDGEERLSGYGQIPVQLRQLQVPEGGTLSIAKQVATEVDGVTPRLLNPKDLKKLQQDRASLFKQAIDTPDYGTPGRFEAVSEDSQTYRGSFTPMQIKAIQDLPEGIVPLKIKKYLLDLNEAIVKKDGTRFYVDYAAVMDDKGNYKAFSPKIYDVVPIGLHLSKDGNFLVTTISAGRMIEKLNLWSDRMPNRLNPWGGSKEAFWADFSKKYLDNWTKGIEGSGYDKQGQPIGTNQLDADVQAAEVKKSILNDFLNLFTNETQALNLDRTIIPKRKGDPKNKSLDRTIMSMRIDHMAELLDADHLPKLPIDYEKAKLNFMPEDPIEATETERYPTSERGMYSGLQKTIDEKVQGKFASPDQLKAIVSNPQNAKAEELKWSGVLGEIDRLAAANSGKVPKDKVMEYLRNEGAVKFEEVTLSDESLQKEMRLKRFNASKQKFRESGIYIDESSTGEVLLRDKYSGPPNIDPKSLPENLKKEYEILSDNLSDDRNAEKLDPKYSTYQLPGGANYREVVMTMPVKQNKPPFKQWFEEMNLGSFDDLNETQKNRLFDQYKNEIDPTIPSYTSSHFPDTPNYVAHMRLNERTDAQGNEGLFVEEFQSDRHQAGREKGYENELPSGYKVIENPQLNDPLGGTAKFFVVDQNKKIVGFGDTPKEAQDFFTSRNAGIPDAPFRKDWSLQLFKRALRDAVDADKKWIGWTTGIEQVKRYEQAMRQAVDEITWNTPKGYQKAFAAIKNGNTVLAGKINDDGSVYDSDTADANGKQLSEVIGKEVASKILAENSGTATGDDLTVGGEGMKGFYDQIMPKEVGKYIAKMGGKVEKVDSGIMQKGPDIDKGGYTIPSMKDTPIWRVDITPEMAGKVRGGQLQFMPAEQPTKYEPISARIRPLEGISAPTKVVGAKGLSLGEIEPPVRGKAMLPDMELGSTESNDKLSKLKEFAPKTEDKEGYIGVKSIGNREGQLEFADLLDSNVEQTKNRINILKKQLDEEKKAREKELLKDKIRFNNDLIQQFGDASKTIRYLDNNNIPFQIDNSLRTGSVYIKTGTKDFRFSSHSQTPYGFKTLNGFDDVLSHFEPILTPDSSEKSIQSSDINTSAKPAPDAVIKPFSNALVSSAGLINFLPAYHGTPHEVDKFKLANIGTGEGAQAYGWGLYFAQKKGTATSYRDKLTPRDRYTIKGMTLDQLKDLIGSEASYHVWDSISFTSGNLKQAKESLARWKKELDLESPESVDKAIKFVKTLNENDIKEIKGNLYKVDLDVKDEDLLDWDKPLSEQSEKVQKSLAGLNGRLPNGEELTNKTKGERIYGAFAEGAFGDTEAASMRLFDFGIPGIRYLDGTSRKQGDGTYNYVVFDENLIKILDKNDKPVQDELPRATGLQFMPSEGAKKPKTAKKEPERDIEPDFTHSIGKKLPSKFPDRGYFKIATKPTEDNRVIEYEVDPKTTVLPRVSDISSISGEQVAMLEADRHNTRGSNMGGPLHPWLKSNQAIAKLPDGRGFKPVWANMTAAFVTRAKNIIKNTTSGMALIQLMKEKAHKSNRKFVQDVMSEIDSTSASIPQERLDALHVILELGAKNPAKHLKRYKKAQSLLKDNEITQSEFNLIERFEAKNIEKYKPSVDFLGALGSMKSQATKGNIEGFDKAFDAHISKYKDQDWYKKIVNKYKDKTFSEEASKFTFNQRGSAMDRIDGIPFIPSVAQRLLESMDFNKGKNLDIVAAVQLSKDMDAFAIYTGNDPKQEAKMSDTERYLRDQFIKNPKFRIHPSYDWMMLGPEDANNFILETPRDPVTLFPDYASSHPKETVRTGSKETIVGTMKKSKIPLILKK
jgi:hypothetical protein